MLFSFEEKYGLIFFLFIFDRINNDPSKRKGKRAKTTKGKWKIKMKYKKYKKKRLNNSLRK